MTDEIAWGLPPELAPDLIARVEQLLAEVTTTSAPELVIDLVYRGPLCVVCHQAGKLGGHHGADGHVEWIHRSCHRLLHHRGEPRRTELRRLRRLDRITLMAC